MTVTTMPTPAEASNDGEATSLDEVPVDWQSPVELPNRPGDPTVAMFRKKFGKA